MRRSTPGRRSAGTRGRSGVRASSREDGRFLSAVGDHLGVDGNSYLYEFDPATGNLTLIGDVLSMVDHQPGAWGYGKIHAQMVEGPCGEVYTSTYWGTRRDLVYDRGYTGDLLLRLDPAARTTSVLGVPVPGHGTPSMGGSSALGLLYGEATDPASEPDAGLFFVHDVATGETTIVDDSPDHVGFRSLAVDADGRALFTMPAGHVTRYDPATNELTQLDGHAPGRVHPCRHAAGAGRDDLRRHAGSGGVLRLAPGRLDRTSRRGARLHRLAGDGAGRLRRLLRAWRPRRRLEIGHATDGARHGDRRAASRRRAEPAGRVGPRTDSRWHVLGGSRCDEPPPVRRPQRRPGRDPRGDDLWGGRADGDHAPRRRRPDESQRARPVEPRRRPVCADVLVGADRSPGLRRHRAVGGRHGGGRARRQRRRA